MVVKDAAIQQRVIELRSVGEIPFSTIARIINKEYGEEVTTKDAAQKIWRKYNSDDAWDESFGKSQDILDEMADRAIESYEQGRTAPLEAAIFPEETVDAIREWLGTSWKAPASKKSNRAPLHRKVVAIGDLHGKPSPWITRKIIDIQPDLVIIGGDLLDGKQVSPHPGERKSKREPLTAEAKRIRAFIELIKQETLADIDIFYGNHDHWAENQLLEAGLEWVLDFYPSPLEVITQGIPGVRMVQSGLRYVAPGGEMQLAEEVFAESRYLWIVGDAILSHMNFCGKNPGMAVSKLRAWLDEWRRPLHLPEPALLIQFHGHKTSLNTAQGGYLKLVEPGMAGDPNIELSYKTGYRGSWTPGILDGCYFEQDYHDGSWYTDRNSVKLLSMMS